MVMGWLRRFFYSDDPLVKVVRGMSEPEAQMWRDVLADNGIAATTKNMNFLSVAYYAGPFNDFDMWVKQSDLERARETLGPILEGHEPVTDEDPA
ncbi:MAG: DUF2007 domain-containing protein [Dehalococcoidia bacterium]|nr:DUF2007 domain-containing protein [Dehalococcoidia bacterium]